MRYEGERSLIKLLGTSNSKVKSFWDETSPREIEGINHINEYFMTLDQVARKFKVTRERIRQIELRAINKLRHPKRSKFLKNFMYD